VLSSGVQIERQELRAFLAVVEHGGFRRAAERLHLSQSAVSQAVANLETKLDVQLLVRRGRPQMTEAGKRVLAYAQTVTHEETAALADLQRIRRGGLSTLSLAVNSAVHRLYARELLLDFCERNPLTRLKLSVAPSRELIYGVDDERWELAFGPFQHRMPGHFQTRPLFTERRLLVVHERFPRVAELLADPERVLPQTTLLTSYLDDASQRPGPDQRLRNQFREVWEVGSLDLRLALAEAGKGVMYLSDRVLANLSGYRTIDGLETSAFEREVGLYHKKHRALSEGAKRFLAICAARF